MHYDFHAVQDPQKLAIQRPQVAAAQGFTRAETRKRILSCYGVPPEEASTFAAAAKSAWQARSSCRVEVGAASDGSASSEEE